MKLDILIPDKRVAVQLNVSPEQPELIQDLIASGYELRATGFNTEGEVLTFERRPWLEID